jgi:thymidine kinase
MGNQHSIMNHSSSTSGSLQLFIGCMYAGKTTKLIETYNDVLDEDTDHSVIILTHSSENRYSIDELSTHDKKKIACLKYGSISSFVENESSSIESADLILIDEGQFFDDLTNVVILVEKFHKRVYVFGLDGDFKRNKFGKILDLIPFCDSVEKLQATCKCGNPAIFSNRTIKNDSQILVGSTDVYEPLCRKCYIENNIF